MINAILNDAILTTTATWSVDPVPLAQRESWLRERRAGGWPTLVATDVGGGVLGFCTYGPWRSQGGYVHTVEHSVYLADQSCGRGVGGLLMDALEARAAAGGVHAMVGFLDASNVGSLRFHERRGYAVVGRLPQVGRKFGRWLDLVIVQKLLSAGG